jgi:hypothetical protein
MGLHSLSPLCIPAPDTPDQNLTMVSSPKYPIRTPQMRQEKFDPTSSEQAFDSGHEYQNLDKTGSEFWDSFTSYSKWMTSDIPAVKQTESINLVMLSARTALLDSVFNFERTNAQTCQSCNRSSQTPVTGSSRSSDINHSTG